MKLNTKLFKKTFDLKNSNIFGGGRESETYTECVSATNGSGDCEGEDSKRSVTDDTGQTVEIMVCWE